MPASMVLPGDVEQTLLATLGVNLPQINVGAISEKDINDADQLVLQMPCARQRYVGSSYQDSADNQWLTYNVTHTFEIWCAAEDLTSKEAQRTATLAVLTQVIPLLAGARLSLPDGSLTDPIMLKQVGKLQDDIVGTLFILTIEIAGVAQFPGTLASGSEDN